MPERGTRCQTPAKSPATGPLADVAYAQRSASGPVVEKR